MQSLKAIFHRRLFSTTSPCPVPSPSSRPTYTPSTPTKSIGKTAKRRVKIATITRQRTRLSKRRLEIQKSNNSAIIPIRWKLEDWSNNLPNDTSRLPAFNKLGLLDIVADSVKCFSFQTPSEIQSIAIPRLLKTKENVVMAAETGSGKTLAYLLPIFDRLKRLETNVPSTPSPSSQDKLLDEIVSSWTNTSSPVSPSSRTQLKPSHPQALILLPSKELVSQVTHIAKQLSYTAKLRIVGTVSPGSERGGLKSIKLRMSSPMDILITTPAMLSYLISNKLVYLGNIRTVVFDEADTMFDKGFSQDISNLITLLSRAAETQQESCQFILVTATLPRAVHQLISKLLPNSIFISSTNLHKPPPGLHQRFIYLKPGDTKQNKLVELIRSSKTDVRILIFCNGIPSVNSVSNFLQNKHMNVKPLHSDMKPSERRETVEWFLQESSEIRILVATDLASRGLDTTSVSHVILYDFPTNPVNYLHRIGRTSRMSGVKGIVSSIVTNKDRRLAETISTSIGRKKVIGMR